LFKINKTQTLYQILGVEKNSSSNDIKKAYYKLAKQIHPNKVVKNKQTQAQATVKFKEIAGAYEVLSDPDKRKKYDDLYTNINKTIQIVENTYKKIKLGRFNILFKNNNKKKQCIKRGEELINKFNSLLNISDIFNLEEQYQIFLVELNKYIGEISQEITQ